MNEKILVADDDRNIAELLRLYLVKEGFTPILAADGEEAFHAFETEHPDLILLDLMMPKMGGLEASRRIRKMDREDAESIPIFAMTANAFLDDIAQSKAAGMNEHFSKPLQMEKVIDTIRFYYTAR